MLHCSSPPKTSAARTLCIQWCTTESRVYQLRGKAGNFWHLHEQKREKKRDRKSKANNQTKTPNQQNQNPKPTTTKRNHKPKVFPSVWSLQPYPSEAFLKMTHLLTASLGSFRTRRLTLGIVCLRFLVLLLSSWPPPFASATLVLLTKT